MEFDKYVEKLEEHIIDYFLCFIFKFHAADRVEFKNSIKKLRSRGRKLIVLYINVDRIRIFLFKLKLYGQKWNINVYLLTNTVCSYNLFFFLLNFSRFNIKNKFMVPISNMSHFVLSNLILFALWLAWLTDCQLSSLTRYHLYYKITANKINNKYIY